MYAYLFPIVIVVIFGGLCSGSSPPIRLFLCAFSIHKNMNGNIRIDKYMNKINIKVFTLGAGKVGISFKGKMQLFALETNKANRAFKGIKELTVSECKFLHFNRNPADIWLIQNFLLFHVYIQCIAKCYAWMYLGFN